MEVLSSPRCEMLLQLGYRTGLVESRIIIALEHLYESPLRPFVILGIAGAELPVPVV